MIIMINKCPTCERDFERLEHYPIIYIADFNRVEVPELIGDSFGDLHPETKSKQSMNEPLPKAVRKLFQETRKDALSYEGVLYQKMECLSHDGLVWYQSSRDITELVKGAVARPQIQETLSALEGYVGQEVLTRKLLALPAFRGGIKSGDYYDLSLSFYDAGQTESGLRICRINLNGGWSGGSISCASLSQDLAEMNYEGRIHK
jgi:hypothetical protein